MARTKRKTNPVIPAMEAPAQAQKQYRTAAYVRLSVEDSGKPGADTIEGQKNLLLRFIEEVQWQLTFSAKERATVSLDIRVASL